MEKFKDDADHLKSENAHLGTTENIEKDFDISHRFTVKISRNNASEDLGISSDHSKVVSFNYDNENSAGVVWHLPERLRTATFDQITEAYQNVANNEDALSLDGGQLNSELESILGLNV